MSSFSKLKVTLPKLSKAVPVWTTVVSFTFCWIIVWLWPSITKSIPSTSLAKSKLVGELDLSSPIWTTATIASTFSAFKSSTWFLAVSITLLNSVPFKFLGLVL